MPNNDFSAKYNRDYGNTFRLLKKQFIGLKPNDIHALLASSNKKVFYANNIKEIKDRIYDLIFIPFMQYIYYNPELDYNIVEDLPDYFILLVNPSYPILLIKKNDSSYNMSNIFNFISQLVGDANTYLEVAYTNCKPVEARSKTILYLTQEKENLLTNLEF